MNVLLAGFFACAALHYSIHWWGSRAERALLVFSIQCAVYTGFYLALSSYFAARTIPDCQLALDRFVTFGVLIHAVYLHLYAYLGARRDHLFRSISTAVLVGIAVVHQWEPLRGVVLELRTVELPGGVTGVVPIRTPPSAALAVLYVAVLLNNAYGFFVSRLIWRRDRIGAVLVVGACMAVVAGAGLGFLIDFCNVQAPYVGSWPHAIFVLCMTLFLSREYSARGAELRAHRERLEELVATRTRELEVAKDEAERANQAKSLFLAHISHEIRNPLHVMLAHAQSLDQDPVLGEAQRAKLGVLSSSGKHLRSLINDVLEMSKIEAGRPELVESAFDPWAALVEVERMFAVEAASKGILLSLEGAAGLPGWLLGDGAKVKQVLINLSSNALKFTQRGSICLRAASSQLADGATRVEIVVADTGIGIAPEDGSRIFQPFEQLDAGRRAGGTGLGLAISLAHARLMGGDIRVESVPGVGSAFTFSYVAKPVAAEAMPATRGDIARIEPRSARRKVLIVDDLALNRDILSEFLSERGFETRVAADGADAVLLHADWQPDLVLIDLRMHGMGGLEAIRRMREGESHAAIGALSASALEEDERLALALGANFFLRKPYDYSDLLDEIARVFVPAVQRARAG